MSSTAFSAVKIPPPAEASEQSSQKQLTPQQAAGIFAIPEPKVPNKSIYVRFKSIYHIDCKVKGINIPTTKEIRDAWNQVKHIPTGFTFRGGEEDKENPRKANKALFIQFKIQAEHDDTKERATATTARLKWCEQFSAAAPVHLQETSMRCMDIDEFKRVLQKATAASRGWPSSVPMKFGQALEMAQKRLNCLQETQLKATLYSYLRSATHEQLYAHVHEHVDLLRESNKRTHFQQTRTQITAQNEEIARSLKGEVCSYLKQQMQYDAKLKYGYQTEAYRRGGVTRDMFQKAFGTTSKSITLDATDVGYKSLRYGAYLAYTSINVKLQGSDLVATGKYTMTR